MTISQIARRSLLLAAPAMIAAPRIGLAFIPGAIPWNPQDLATPLSEWWSSDDYATMTDDGSGLISRWLGRYGLAVTAATTARGTWSSSAWTATSVSKPGITLDGSANCYVTTSLGTLPTGSAAGELWALVSATAGASTGNIIRYGSGTNAAANRALAVTSNSLAQVGDGLTNLNNTAGGTFPGAHIFGGYWTGTTEGGRFDGVDFTPAATATIATLNTTATRARIGASNAGAASNFLNCVVRHIIVTSLLSAADRLRMEGFLAWDGWSTASANPLPATHPYKYGPPTL